MYKIINFNRQESNNLINLLLLFMEYYEDLKDENLVPKDWENPVEDAILNDPEILEFLRELDMKQIFSGNYGNFNELMSYF